MKPHVIYVGAFRMPEGDAAAARVLGIGKALRDGGYCVTFGGGEESGRPQDRQPDGSYRYQEFPYISLGEIRSRPLPPLSRLWNYLATGSSTLRWLATLDPAQVSAVMMYNPLAGYHERVGSWCRRHKIALIVDCTEWHDPTSYPGGRFGLHRWDVEWTMRRGNRRCGNVIAVSSYLEDYYRNRGCHVLRVPPLVDFSDAKWPRPERDPGQALPLRWMYAGSPGKKDCLEQLLEAAWILKQKNAAAVLEIVGASADQIAAAGPRAAELIDRLGASLLLSGRLSTPADALQRMAQADLLVVVKYPGRSAEAQFPTKLVEYMTIGRPVLANRTSDVAEYVRDAEEGFLTSDSTAESVAAAVERALRAGPDVLAAMGQRARQRAEACFDYRRYVAPLSGFMDEVLKHRPGSEES